MGPINGEIMADKPINLRLRRKQRARDEKRARGDATAAQTGIARSERITATKITDLAARRLDGHKISEDTRDNDE